MFEEKWNAYAQSWSQPDVACEAALLDLVTDDVAYADPSSEVAGRDAFAAHMAQFRKDVPGASFEIIDVKSHHGQTLARWRLNGQGGSEIMLGTSYATLEQDGKFSSFTGFF